MTAWTKFLGVITPRRHAPGESAYWRGCQLSMPPGPSTPPDDDPQYWRIARDWTALDDVQLHRLLQDPAS